MFIPKKKEIKKLQKNKVRISAVRNTFLSSGEFGLKVKESSFITSNQLEMLRVLLVKKTKKVGKFWLRIFPHTPITSKPLEVRMGKGKGHISHWICKLKAGVLLLEISGLSRMSSLSLLKELSIKLAFKTLIILK